MSQSLDNSSSKLPKCLMRHLLINYVELKDLCKLYLISKDFHALNHNDNEFIIEFMDSYCMCNRPLDDICIIDESIDICNECDMMMCKKCIYSNTYKFEYYKTTKECNNCKIKLCRECINYCRSCGEEHGGILMVHCWDCYIKLDEYINSKKCDYCNETICSSDSHEYCKELCTECHASYNFCGKMDENIY